ncbi:PspC domain-containing protein [Uniformispora flossi]|uniref:PspC domain-containing protein n=1 Tax=Uniformispora flossi TaxID=3390723 RepID=UPI003C2C8866
MSDPTSTSTQTPPPPGADGGSPPLTRDTHDRVVAGVAGGLGRHFGVDPVIFRVVLAVIALFGGLGVLLYGLGWLLMPSDDRPVPMARDVLNGHKVKEAVPAIVLTAVGIGTFFSYFDDGFMGTWPLLIVAGIVLAASRKKSLADAVAAASRRPEGDAAEFAAAPTAPTAPEAAEAGGGPPVAPGPAPWWQRSGARGGAPEPKPPARPRKPASFLAPAVVSAAAFAGGLMWWLDSTTEFHVQLEVGIAVMLAILAGGLLLGAFFGRARWLILPAVVLAGVLSMLAYLTVPFTGSTGQETHTPATPAAVQSPYRMKFGDLRLDLRQLDPVDGTRITASVGVGSLRVSLPDDVRAVITAKSDIGMVQVVGRDNNGLKVSRQEVVEPVRGTLRGTVTLDLRVGIGEVVVYQEGAPIRYLPPTPPAAPTTPAVPAVPALPTAPEAPSVPGAPADVAPHATVSAG